MKTACRTAGRARVSARAQRGVTLVELMIGVTLGLLVIVAALGTFVFTRQSGEASGDALRLQQQAQNVFRVLRAQAAQTGSFALVDRNDAVAGAAVSAQSGVADTASWAIEGTEGANGAADTLTISHSSQLPVAAAGVVMPDAPDSRTVPNCLDGVDANPAAGALIVSTFSLVGDRLACDANLDAPPDDLPSRQTLARGVEDFQLRYGVRNPFTGEVAYRLASELGTQPAVDPTWAQVQSLEVCLQLTGARGDNPRVGAVTGCDGQAVAADGRLRRVFREVVALRNHQVYSAP